MYNTQLSEGLSISNTISKLIKDVKPFRDERLLILNPTKGVLPAIKFLFPTSQIDICDIIISGHREYDYSKMNIYTNSFDTKIGSPVGYYDIIIVNESDTIKNNLDYVLDLSYGRLILLGNVSDIDYNYKYIIKRISGSSRVCSIHTLTSDENNFSHCSLLVEHYMRESVISDEVEQLKRKIDSDAEEIEALKNRIKSMHELVMTFIGQPNKPKIRKPSQPKDTTLSSSNKNIDSTSSSAKPIIIYDHISTLTLSERNELIAKLFDSGKTNAEISKELNMGYAKVRYVLEKMGRVEHKKTR